MKLAVKVEITSTDVGFTKDLMAFLADYDFLDSDATTVVFKSTERSPTRGTSSDT